MPDRIGLFTGSFDPITKAHVDVIERASHLFDKLYVGIFFNHEKKEFLTIEKRYEIVTKAVAYLPTVEVVTSCDELAVDLAQKLGVSTFVRGLRNSQDLEYEANLSFFNRNLAANIETIFLLSHPDNRFISSSRIRELIAFKQDISAYVPKSVVEELEKND